MIKLQIHERITHLDLLYHTFFYYTYILPSTLYIYIHRFYNSSCVLYNYCSIISSSKALYPVKNKYVRAIIEPDKVKFYRRIFL